MFGRPLICTPPLLVLEGTVSVRAVPERIARSCDSKALGYARPEERMSITPAARELHGRELELALIRDELERLSEGSEVAVIIEGAAGMGKSRLLDEVTVVARSHGIRVGRSAADPSETMVELAALLDALFLGVDPLLDPEQLGSLHARPEQRFWLLRDLQQLLEKAALESPLLIAIDDAIGQTTERSPRSARSRCASWECRSPG